MPAKKTKGVTFDAEASGGKARPGYGLLILRYLLSHSLNKAILLKKNFKQLDEIKTTLKVRFLSSGSIILINAIQYFISEIFAKNQISAF